MKRIVYFDFWGTLYNEKGMIRGVKEMILQLAKEKMLVIVSSMGSESIRRILDEEGIKHCFLHVFGKETGRSKSETMLACGIECSVLVTDTVADVLEALKAGVEPIGVSWGIYKPKDLLNAGAKTVLEKPEDILVTLAK